MGFMDLPPRRRRGTAIDRAMILGVAALSLAAAYLADDELAGRSRVSDALGFTLLFVAIGTLLGRLPKLWEATAGTIAEPLVTPGFIALIVAYLYLGFRAYFLQPGPTGAAMLMQLAAMVGLQYRAR